MPKQTLVGLNGDKVMAKMDTGCSSCFIPGPLVKQYSVDVKYLDKPINVNRVHETTYITKVCKDVTISVGEFESKCDINIMDDADEKRILVGMNVLKRYSRLAITLDGVLLTKAHFDS